MAAATNMMERFEEAQGWQFEVIVRMRPDVCAMDASHFVNVALARTSCASLLTVQQSDVLQVAPRWLARAPSGGWLRIATARQTHNSSECGGLGLRFDVHPHHYGEAWGRQVRLRRPTVGCAKWV
eukprot:1214661-Prymnesium_polylepis.1